MNPIARRQFLLATLTVPLVAAAREQRTKPYRIGLLGAAYPKRLADALANLGYVEGRDIVLEVRNIEGRIERLDAMAAELARLEVDLIVAPNPSAVLSARRATRTIPIVMMHTPDPVQLGLVESLAAPRGNVTGVTTLSADISLKQLEILQEAIAGLARVALLWNPDNPWHPSTVRMLRARGGPIGLQVRDVEVRGPAAFDGAYATAAPEGAQAMLILTDPMTFFHRQRLAELALHHRLPTMCGLADYAEAGCLMSYWADSAEVYRRTASYIDRLLKGAKPADLPIEQPTKFELVVNLKTARALGIRVPQAILVRADRLID
jgi:putative ABC transport system substrate-binding protein